MSSRWVRALVVSALFGASACGDDEGEEPKRSSQPDASNTPSGGMHDAGPDMTPEKQRFMCGSTACFVPGESLVDFFTSLGLPASPSPFSPCCTEDNECGVALQQDSGISCVPKPESDPRCPDVPVFDAVQPGCCIEEMGICGINGAQVGLGCYDPTGGLGPVFGVPTRKCKANPPDGGALGDGDGDTGVDEDAGQLPPDDDLDAG